MVMFREQDGCGEGRDLESRFVFCDVVTGRPVDDDGRNCGWAYSVESAPPLQSPPGRPRVPIPYLDSPLTPPSSFLKWVTKRVKAKRVSSAHLSGRTSLRRGTLVQSQNT